MFAYKDSIFVCILNKISIQLHDKTRALTPALEKLADALHKHKVTKARLENSIIKNPRLKILSKTLMSLVVNSKEQIWEHLQASPLRQNRDSYPTPYSC